MAGVAVMIQCSVKNPGSGRGQGEGNHRVREPRRHTLLPHRIKVHCLTLSIMGATRQHRRKTYFALTKAYLCVSAFRITLELYCLCSCLSDKEEYCTICVLPLALPSKHGLWHGLTKLSLPCNIFRWCSLLQEHQPLYLCLLRCFSDIKMFLFLFITSEILSLVVKKLRQATLRAA